MPSNKISFLIACKHSTDVDLISSQIREITAEPVIQTADSFADLENHISTFHTDVIISEYALDDFTGIDLLSHIHSTKPDINCIFISDNINCEELADQTVLALASGYVFKKDILTFKEKLTGIIKKIEHERLPHLQDDYQISYHQTKEFLFRVRKDNKAHLDSCKQIMSALVESRQVLKNYQSPSAITA